MIKKTVLLALPLLVAMTGCVEHLEDVSTTTQKKITFQTAKYLQSRAADDQINGTKFTYDHFVAHAWSDAVVNDDKVLMNHQRVVKDDNSGSWMPVSDHYWPSYSTVDFIAYYPENEDKTFPIVSRETLSYSGYDVSDDKADISVQTNDLMYAEKAVGYGSNVDQVNDDNGGGNDSGYSGVPMLFHHALAQLEIRVQVVHPDEDSPVSWNAVIDHAKLSGYYTKGDLELTLNDTQLSHGVTGWTPTTPDMEHVKVGWKNDGQTKSQMIIGDDASVQTLTITDDGSGDGYVATGCKTIYKAFVLPQILTDLHTLDLSFTLESYRDGVKETSESDTEIRHLQLKTDATPHWGMNQHVVYTIVINPSIRKISFDPAITGWEDVSVEKSAEDYPQPATYFRIPDENDWNESNVWHAYDRKGNNIAEVAKELLNDYTNKMFYQSVVVYPSANEYADLTQGSMAQVLNKVPLSGATVLPEAVEKMAGGKVAWNKREICDASTPAGYFKSLTFGEEDNFQYVLVDNGEISLIQENDIPSDAVMASLRPYTVTDYDGNVYPVAKLAGTYWLRENLRVTHYTDGTPLTQRRSIDDLTSIANNTVPQSGHVYMPETVATYDWYSNDDFDAATASDDVKKLYGLNYNYRAIAGSSDPDITTGYYGSAYIIQNGDPTASTSNKHLAPKGWHVATMAYEEIHAFGYSVDDISYVDEYIRYKWRHLMSESDGRNYAEAKWGIISDYPTTNLSGLSLNAVPALGQTVGFDTYLTSRPKDPFFKDDEITCALLFWQDYLSQAPTGVYYWNAPIYLDDSVEMLGQDWGFGDNVSTFEKKTKDQVEKFVKVSIPVRCVRD